jgi:Uma2 family endonuclease
VVSPNRGIDRTVPPASNPDEEVSEMDVAVQRYRFTVDQYHELAKAGILSEECRVELIDGEIIEMSPIGAEHMYCVAYLTAAFIRGLADRAVIWPQNSLRLGEHSEPEPDIVLLRPPLERYRAIIPWTADALLVVEVADTSLRYDRELKLPRYAATGVPEVWIVDLNGGAVEMYRGPTSDGYRTRARSLRGEEIAAAAFPDLHLPVSEILGAPTPRSSG